MTGAERAKRFRERRQKAGFRDIRLTLKGETKAELVQLVKQTGSHEAALRQLLDQARANS